jgi:hypothetical protein
MSFAAALAKAGINTEIAAEADRRKLAIEIANSAGAYAAGIRILAGTKGQQEFIAATRVLLGADQNLTPLIRRVAEQIQPDLVGRLRAMESDLRSAVAEDVSSLIAHHLED